MYVYVYIFVYMCMYMCMRMCMYMCVCACMCMYMYVCMQCMYVCMHATHVQERCANMFSESCISIPYSLLVNFQHNNKKTCSSNFSVGSKKNLPYIYIYIHIHIHISYSIYTLSIYPSSYLAISFCCFICFYCSWWCWKANRSSVLSSPRIKNKSTKRWDLYVLSFSILDMYVLSFSVFLGLFLQPQQQ
jgi:hypothetical protein